MPNRQHRTKPFQRRAQAGGALRKEGAPGAFQGNRARAGPLAVRSMLTDPMASATVPSDVKKSEP